MNKRRTIMSNKNENIIKNKDVFTVKEFCEKYNGTNVEQTKQDFIKKVMNQHYVPYEKKITICEKIIENSYYKKSEDGESRRLHINSPAQYMLYCLNLINEYTNIKIDFSNALEEFNILNECGALDIIIFCISDKESKEFRSILDMVENDVLQNEYETHAFISNQVERFGELFGHIAKPALDRLSEVLENMDEKSIDKMFNKLKGLKGKFDIIK
jgi:hypothetical protein